MVGVVGEAGRWWQGAGTCGVQVRGGKGRRGERERQEMRENVSIKAQMQTERREEEMRQREGRTGH